MTTIKYVVTVEESEKPDEFIQVCFLNISNSGTARWCYFCAIVDDLPQVGDLCMLHVYKVDSDTFSWHYQFTPIERVP